MRDVIRVMDVSKSFGEETVLHHISYDFKEGRIYGIVGNNGSGKTVLMKCICGFLIPESAKIWIFLRIRGLSLKHRDFCRISQV